MPQTPPPVWLLGLCAAALLALGSTPTIEDALHANHQSAVHSLRLRRSGTATIGLGGTLHQSGAAGGVLPAQLSMAPTGERPTRPATLPTPAQYVWLLAGGSLCAALLSRFGRRASLPIAIAGMTGDQEDAKSGGANRQQAVLGGLDFIYSQRSGVEEDLFKGRRLGVDADIASMQFRERAGARSLAGLDADLFVPPRFERRVATHLAKNYLLAPAHHGVPLILGVWGAKGAGKSFNVELTCKRAGVHVVALSAGELEDEWAGGVAQRIRDRYRVCADMVRREGQPAVLVISDIDAGLGRMKDVQMTVNTQTATGELMALCDGVWPGGVRVPIIVTANDLSRVYAPLLRDGRMEKWYWEPAEEKAAMLHATMHRDGAACLSAAEAQALVAAFPDQPLDFFAAACARVVDDDVLAWVRAQGGPERMQRVLMEQYDAGKGAAVWSGANSAPVTFDALRRECAGLAEEQQRVLDERLAAAYFRHWATADDAARARREKAEAERRWRAEEVAMAMAAQVASLGTEDLAVKYDVREAVATMIDEQTAAAEEASVAAAAAAAANATSAWRVVEAEEAYRLLEEGYTLLDIRSARVFGQEAIAGARNVPMVDTVGVGLQRQEVPRPSFADDVAAALAAAGQRAVLAGATEADTAHAAGLAVAAGCPAVVALRGGYEGWLAVFTLKRKQRQYGNWGNRDRLLYDYWTASN